MLFRGHKAHTPRTSVGSNLIFDNFFLDLYYLISFYYAANKRSTNIKKY